MSSAREATKLGFAPAQAPTSGRLAAAIATNCAIRRRIRDGVARNNEVTRCIEKPSMETENAAIRPCRQRQNGRERTPSRASRKNSNGRPADSTMGSSFVALRRAATEEIFFATEDRLRYFGITPKVRANRSL